MLLLVLRGAPGAASSTVGLATAGSASASATLTATAGASVQIVR